MQGTRLWEGRKAEPLSEGHREDGAARGCLTPEPADLGGDSGSGSRDGLHLWPQSLDAGPGLGQMESCAGLSTQVRAPSTQTHLPVPLGKTISSSPQSSFLIIKNLKYTEKCR